MIKQITAESYRAEQKEKAQKIRDWVDNNFETFWRLAREAQALTEFEAFRIDTHFGAFVFNPGLPTHD